MENSVKTILIITFIIFFSKSYSQETILKFGYSDMKYLLENNIEEADSYLSLRNFEFQTVSKSEDCDATVWSYKRNIKNDASIAFVSKNCSDANKGFIWFQTADKRIYNNIKEQCKSIGFKYSNSETDEFNQLCLLYKRIKYKITFCSGIHPDSNKNVYLITLELNK